VVTRDRRAILALGASGGNHIVPAVAQLAALVLDFGMTLEQAIAHPRLDASDRGSVRCDPALGEAVIARLAQRQPVELAERSVFPKLYACVSGVARENGECVGMSDPSQPIGGASGPVIFSAPDSTPVGAAVHA